MPELPDVTVYIESLEPRILGQQIWGARALNPFVLRTVDPPLSSVVGKQVRTISRLGKRIVIGTDDALYIVIHLMIAGRLRWREGGKAIGGKLGQAAFEFETGTLYLTEAGTKRRASMRSTSRLRRREAGRPRAPAAGAPWFSTAPIRLRCPARVRTETRRG